jgi:hypothetical protein
MRYLGEDEVTEVMGIGYPGEIAQAPDGNLYQWVETVDGLGNPVGFWRKLRRVAKRVAKGVRRVRSKLRPLVRGALKIGKRVAPLVPGVGPAAATALRAATPVLRRAGVAGYNGLGALYQAPDGTVYELQGLAEDDELDGLAEDEEVEGFSQDEGLEGIAEEEDQELQGISEDEEMGSLAQDDEPENVGEDEELSGLDQGYVREQGPSGIEAYVPEQQPTTRWFVSPTQPPELWKPLW